MTEARLEYYRNPNFLTWVHAEAAEIDADGCSGVTGARVECCEIHDVEFFYGKDARSAYRAFKRGSLTPWQDADPITFDDANAHFRRCHQARSKCGMYSPFAIWRWLGVKFLSKSRNSWTAHRARDERKEA